MLDGGTKKTIGGEQGEGGREWKLVIGGDGEEGVSEKRGMNREGINLGEVRNEEE